MIETVAEFIKDESGIAYNFCKSCERVQAEIDNLKKTNQEQAMEIKSMRNMLYQVLTSALVAAGMGIINLIVLLSDKP